MAVSSIQLCRLSSAAVEHGMGRHESLSLRRDGREDALLRESLTIAAATILGRVEAGATNLELRSTTQEKAWRQKITSCAPFSACNIDKRSPCVDAAPVDAVVDTGEQHSESLEDGCTAPCCEEGDTGRSSGPVPTAVVEGVDMTRPCRVDVRSEAGACPEAAWHVQHQSVSVPRVVQTFCFPDKDRGMGFDGEDLQDKMPADTRRW